MDRPPPSFGTPCPRAAQDLASRPKATDPLRAPTLSASPGPGPPPEGPSPSPMATGPDPERPAPAPAPAPLALALPPLGTAPPPLPYGHPALPRAPLEAFAHLLRPKQDVSLIRRKSGSFAVSLRAPPLGLSIPCGTAASLPAAVEAGDRMIARVYGPSAPSLQAPLPPTQLPARFVELSFAAPFEVVLRATALTLPPVGAGREGAWIRGPGDLLARDGGRLRPSERGLEGVHVDPEARVAYAALHLAPAMAPQLDAWLPGGEPAAAAVRCDPSAPLTLLAGPFASEDLAAAAYDRLAFKFLGEGAVLNRPGPLAAGSGLRAFLERCPGQALVGALIRARVAHAELWPDATASLYEGVRRAREEPGKGVAGSPSGRSKGGRGGPMWEAVGLDLTQEGESGWRVGEAVRGPYATMEEAALEYDRMRGGRR